MENLIYIDQFKDYLYENDKSKKTIESYATDVKSFIYYFFKELNHDSFNDLTKNDTKKYTEFLKQLKNDDGDPLSVKTINRKLVSINRFFVFLNDELDMKIPVKFKQLKISTQNFSEDELDINDVRRIIRAAEKENDVRAITIFYTLFYTGARVSEMLQIRAKDTDKDSITISGKGSKYRELLIPKKLKAQWKLYKETRLGTTDFLFSGERGPLSRQTVHNTIKEYTGKARGIDKSLAHAHSFRHLYAQSLAELGVQPIIIAQLLGHSVNVTGIYLSHSKKELLSIINKLDIEGAEVKKKNK